MTYVNLIIGTVLTLLFIIQNSRGKKYEAMFAGLDETEFPLKDLYGVGLAWSTSGPLKMKDQYSEKLQMQARLLYDPKYAQYYASIYWAQGLTLAHLILAMTCLASVFLAPVSALVLLVGLIMTAAALLNITQSMKNTLSSRTEECESQLPEIVSTMAILVNSGMVLREAWSEVAGSRDGAIYSLMRQAEGYMRSGYTDSDAIFTFGQESNSAEIKKFTSALLQSMEKGGAELSGFLAHQSSELWNEKRQRMLQSGEKAATKLLAPIMMIFMGVIIIVMTAAFGGSLF